MIAVIGAGPAGLASAATGIQAKRLARTVSARRAYPEAAAPVPA